MQWNGRVDADASTAAVQDPSDQDPAGQDPAVLWAPDTETARGSRVAEFARWVRTLGTYKASREVLSPAELPEPAAGDTGRQP